MAKTMLLRLTALLLGLALPAFAGCGSDAPAQSAREAPKVTVVHPVVHALTDEADYNGWLEAFKSVDVRARVKGHITAVNFKDGDIVTADKTDLFEIDDAPLKAELAQSEAQARALDAQEEAAEKVAERNRELIKTHAISQQELEKSEADAKSFGAQIEAKKAEAARINLDIQYCKIKAPLSGRVAKANLIKGDYVNAGGTDPILTTIVSIDPVYVDFDIDERAIQRYQLANIKQSNREKTLRDLNISFTFGLDSEKGYPHGGKLVYRDPNYARGTGTMFVRGETQNQDGLFIPGSCVRVRLPVGDKYQATLVPAAAVCTDQKQKYLLVVDEKKNVKRVNVELGPLRDDGMWIILSPPLKADDAVISEGMERTRINYPAEPILDSAQAEMAVGK